MKLDKKRLAARALNVGIERIRFNNERLAEIKEAITKQDIRDLAKDGALFVKEVSGRKTHERSKQRRRTGSFRKKVDTSKKDYVTFIRGARRAIAHAKEQGTLSGEHAQLLRKEIRSGRVNARAMLRERMKEVQRP